MADGLSATFGQGTRGQPQNFSLAAGETRVLKVTVFDENGVPVQITGASAIVWKLARTARSANTLIKALGSGVTVITDNAATGQANCGRLDVTLDGAASAALTGEYVHECRVTLAAGPFEIFHGRVFVRRALA